MDTEANEWEYSVGLVSNMLRRRNKSTGKIERYFSNGDGWQDSTINQRGFYSQKNITEEEAIVFIIAGKDNGK